MFRTLDKMHAMLDRPAETLKEVSFLQMYGRDLQEAQRWCELYKVCYFIIYHCTVSILFLNSIFRLNAKKLSLILLYTLIYRIFLLLRYFIELSSL